METLTGVLSAYSQCREEVDGSWAADPSWECQEPGDQATGTLPSAASTSAQPVVAAAASSSVAAGSNSDFTPSTTLNQDSSSDGAGTTSASQGSCDSTIAPSGWDGVASTSVSFAPIVSNVVSRTATYKRASTMAGWAPLATAARHHGNGPAAAGSIVALSTKRSSMVNSTVLVSRIAEQPVVLATSSPQVASTRMRAALLLARHSPSRSSMLVIVVEVNGVVVLAMISRMVRTVACILIFRPDHRAAMGSQL